MIIVFGTDVTLIAVFIVGFIIGNIRKDNLRLKKENTVLKKQRKPTQRPEANRTP